MPTESHVATIAHVIQLAIAPVFLLSGVGTLIGSMLALFLALLSFLREIFIAIRALRIAANPPAAGRRHSKRDVPLVRE